MTVRRGTRGEYNRRSRPTVIARGVARVQIALPYMYTSLLRRFGLVAVVGFLAPSAAAAQDSLHVVVVSTTDIHGHVLSWDFVADREAPWGMDRAATVVDSLRRAYPGR